MAHISTYVERTRLYNLYHIPNMGQGVY